MSQNRRFRAMIAILNVCHDYHRYHSKIFTFPSGVSPQKNNLVFLQLLHQADDAAMGIS
jgi:hypothetical protein